MHMSESQNQSFVEAFGGVFNGIPVELHMSDEKTAISTAIEANFPRGLS
jgi:hypothetical protein